MFRLSPGSGEGEAADDAMLILAHSLYICGHHALKEFQILTCSSIIACVPTWRPICAKTSI